MGERPAFVWIELVTPYLGVEPRIRFWTSDAERAAAESASGRNLIFYSSLIAQQDHAETEQRNRELTRQVEQLQARLDAADKAMSAVESFIAVMFGQGPDALIPETVNTPLGIPIQLRKIMLNLVLAQSLTAPPFSSDPGRADTEKMS